MIPLIISLISIFIVASVATTIYVQNSKQKSEYDKRLKEVVTKTNDANQYEYEKNKDQEVSLDKIRNDVVGYDSRMHKLQNDFNHLKSQQETNVAKVSKDFNELQSNVSKGMSTMNTENKVQTTGIANLNTSLNATNTKVGTLGRQVAVMNGRLVNIEQKQQGAIDQMTSEVKSMQSEHGDLKNNMSSLASTTATRMSNQDKTVADMKTSLTNSISQHDATITKIQSTASSVENIVVTLNTALENLKQSLNDYMKKVDMAPYATKEDIGVVNNTFGNYLSKADFNTFKTNLPDYPTRTEMNTLVTSFLTKTDVVEINNTVLGIQKTLNEISATVSAMQASYATKNDMLIVTGEVSSGLVNAQSMLLTLQSVQDGLKSLGSLLTETNNTVAVLKTDVANIYASKTDLTNVQNLLTQQINNLQNTSSSIMDSLVVNKSFTAIGNVELNNMRFSKDWTAYPDNATDKSEISNDTTGFKKLMIVGNKSGGAERRVGIWDKLDVHGSLGVDASATAQNVDAKGSVTVGDKAWMKNDGSVYASSKLGVGVSTDDGAFARRQMLVRGGRADDWQAQLTNVNGSRNVYMNHGDGYGMHINTNDQRGDRYGLEIHNGSGATFQVFNDGRIRGYGKNSGDWNDVQMNPNGGGVYMNHGQGYGMHINSRNTEDGKYGLEVHNGSRTTFKVRNSGHVDVAETLTANNINTNNVQSGVLRANSHLCIGGTCIDEGTLRRMRDSGSGITNGTRVRLQSSQTGRNLENGGGSTGGATVGAYGWDGHINKTWWIYNA